MKTNLPVVAMLLMLFLSLRLSAQTNIALKKHTTSSGLENGAQYHDSLAVDGKGGASQMNGSGNCSGTCSRWSSAFSDSQWICINLGASYAITSVNLYWEVANGKNFTLQTSPDSITWTIIQTAIGNSSFSNSYTFSRVTAKYIRMYGTARNTPYGYSLWEFEVYGTPVSILPIRLAAFTAIANKSTVRLNWKAFIDDPTFLTIERSSDAARFLPITRLELPHTSNGLITGDFIDLKPVAGKNYYRLQMMGSSNSSIIYSKVVEVNMGNSPTVSVFPNPVHDNTIHIALNQVYSGKMEVALTNTAGILIQKQSGQVSNASQYDLNLPRKPATGIYWLTVTQNQATTHVKVMVD